jgi:hypothetical protein
LTTKAVGGLLNIIPGVGGALKELAGAAGDAAKFVLAQFDDLAKNYQALGESSAITAKGLDGVQEQFRKMGLMTLPAFARAINQNTVGFTALGGTVAEGAEQFSKLAGAMTTGNIADNFIKLGMSIDGIGESSAKYVAAFTRYGLTQGRTFEQLRDSTHKYMLEVDQIARLTGNTRKQQEDEQQKNLGHVRMRAKLEVMRQNGQIHEAEEMEKYVNGLTGPMADAARAYLTGIPLTEEAAQADMALGGAIRESLTAIQNGAKATTMLANTQRSAAEGTKQWAPLWQYTGEIAGGITVQMMDQAAIYRRQLELEKEGLGTAEARAKAEQEELLKQQGSTKGFADSQQKVAQANKDMANLSFSLVNAAIPAVNAFASGLQKVTGYIDKKFGGAPSAGSSGAKSSGSGSGSYIDRIASGVSEPSMMRRFGMAIGAVGAAPGTDSGDGATGAAGLHLKSGAEKMGSSTDKLYAMAQQVHKMLGGNYKYFSGLKDRGIDAGGAHPQGRAFDLVLNDPSQYAGVAAQMRALGGFSQVLDESQGPANPAQRDKWAPHIHAEVSAANGAILSGPMSGYRPNLTMHGTEAIVPLNSSINQAMSNMGSGNDNITLLGRQLDKLDELAQIMRNSLNVQEKTYRASAS